MESGMPSRVSAPTVSGQEDVATAAPSWGTSRVLMTGAVYADERICKSQIVNRKS